MDAGPRIAIDAMGGDSGPPAMIAGAARALRKDLSLRFTFYGDQQRIDDEIERHRELREGIAIRMDMLSKSDGKKTRITMTLKNLQVGAQDPQLFELPAGYNKMPAMGFGFGKGKGLGGLGGALKGAVSKFGQR